jgi:hypothetical protein
MFKIHSRPQFLSVIVLAVLARGGCAPSGQRRVLDRALNIEV